MNYLKRLFQDASGKIISWFSTDDNVLCENNKYLRENLNNIDTELKSFQKKTDKNLETENKEIVGAVNEVNMQCKDIAKDGVRISKYNPFCDGINPDNVAIIQAIADSNGIIILEEGKRYYIDNPLEVDKDIIFIANKNHISAKDTTQCIFDGNVSIQGNFTLNLDTYKVSTKTIPCRENKATQLSNTIGSETSLSDFANFAGQGKTKSNVPIGFAFHHYTDGNVMQIDNVGENNNILILKPHCV